MEYKPPQNPELRKSPDVEDVVEKKGRQSGESPYEEDQTYLTHLTKKHENGTSFTKDDLRFLYELDRTIEVPEYGPPIRDPRIEELRATRNPEEDMLVIFDCTKEQIAHNPSELTEDTRAYVGQLEPGIFNILPQNLEHVYTSFPESETIRRYETIVGGKDRDTLIHELKERESLITDSAGELLEKMEITQTSEQVSLVRLTPKDLGFRKFPNKLTVDDIYSRAKKLGLELCKDDTGPHLFLSTDSSKAMNIGMPETEDEDGNRRVFSLSGNWLGHKYTTPDNLFGPGLDINDAWVFRIRKSNA